MLWLLGGKGDSEGSRRVKLSKRMVMTVRSDGGDRGKRWLRAELGRGDGPGERGEGGDSAVSI